MFDDFPDSFFGNGKIPSDTDGFYLAFFDLFINRDPAYTEEFCDLYAGEKMVNRHVHLALPSHYPVTCRG